MENNNNMEHKNTFMARRCMHIVGSLSLILAPLGVAIGWMLNYPSFSAFFTFDKFTPVYLLSGTSDSVTQFLRTITSADGGFRLFLLPHYIIYVTIPLFIIVSLFLAYTLFRKAPWHALIGAIITSIGAVYFIGVLGAWLSFPAITNTPVDQLPNLLPVLTALSTPGGALLFSTALSIFVFLGMIILGFGFYKSRIIPRWSAVLVIVGNILILAFAGIENLMAIGMLLTLVGLLPLSLGKLHRTQLERQA